MNNSIPNENLVIPEDAVEVISGIKNVVFDATLLTSVMTCGRFADLRFNHNFGLLSGKSNSLEVGSIVHKGLEIYYRSIIQGHNKTSAIGHAMMAADLYIKGCPHCTKFKSFLNEESGLEITKPICGHPPNEYPGVKNTPPESTTVPSRTGWMWAISTLEQYFEFYKNDFWVPLETEVVKKKVLFQDDNIRVLWKGKLDLVVDTNRGIYPCDHKTMKQNRDIVSLNNQFMGQSILMGTNGVMINKVGFQTTLAADKKFLRVLVPYTPDRLMEWQSEILPYWAYQLVSYVEGNYYPPNFTQCEGKFGPCIYQNVCTAERNMREVVLRTDFEVTPKWDIDNVETD